MKNHFKPLTLLGVTLCLAGCAIHEETTKAATPAFQVEQSSHAKDGWHKAIVPTSDAIALLKDWEPYAAMADASYRREFATPRERLDHGCDYMTSRDARDLTFNLPRGWQRLDRALIDRWQLERDEPAGKPLRPCRSGRGLDYETYVRLDEAGRPLQAVIAFRGTENTKLQWKDDWLANFSNVDFGLGTDPQFRDTRDEGPRLVKALAKVLPKVEPGATCKLNPDEAKQGQTPIVLVGHSLGGGLAQHLAYVSSACDVWRTLTFDTSPSNGWFFLWRRGLITTHDPIIERIYLDDEGLSIVRKVSTKFNMVRNHRQDYCISSADVSGGAFKRHSMTLLLNEIRRHSGSHPDIDRVPDVNYADKTIYPEMTGAGGGSN